MKALLLYRINSETERLARDFSSDYERQTGKQLEVMDVDSPEGMEIAKLYDIMSYPAIIARAENGSLLQLWQGEPLPLISEVSYYSTDR